MEELAGKAGLDIPHKELRAEANKWELSHEAFPEGRPSSLLPICRDRLKAAVGAFM